MKLYDAIAEVKQTNQCKFDNDMLVKAISDLDERIYKEIIQTHVPHPCEDFVRYDDPGSEADRSLLVGGTYAIIYRHWCDMQIYLANGENDKYNSSTALFQAAWKDYENYYNRKYFPVFRGFRYF